ncbi:MAG: PAS domain S-box protein [Proteobacteria bacterium]|nr:PAS domain S-box protein [Pseudomonadota bacterium]
MENKMKEKEFEEIFQKFSEYSLTGIYIIQDGYFVYVNPKFAHIFGYTIEECLNKTHFSKFVHPDDLGLVEEQLRRRAAGEVTFLQYGFRGIKKNGAMIHVEIYGSSILYKGRTAATGTMLDVTDRRQAEEINKTLFAISNAVNTTPNLQDLYVAIHNSLGNIMDVTNFFIALVDIKENSLHFPYHVDTVDDEFSPITNFDTNGSLTGLVFSQSRPVLLKKKQLEKRASQKGVRGVLPLIWMGAPLIVKKEVIGVVAAQSYLDPNLYTEQDLQILSMVSDQIAIAIDHKRTQDALMESEKKYRYLFKNAPAGIFEIDLEKFRFINVNEFMCKNTGYSEKEFLSMNPLDFLTKNSKNLYMERLEKLSTGEKLARNVEYNIIKKDGQQLSAILNNDFIYKNGKLTGARVVAHDITELKKAQEEKIKAQKSAGENEKLALVGQIAGKIAHDFNNMLTIIMGNIDLALMDCKDAAIKKTLELIYKETMRGKSLTKNLVAFARDQEPRQEFFRINEKIDLVINLLKKDLEEIELIREYKTGVPELLADPGMIEHALINLIQNSIHATSKIEHPRITIKTDCIDNMICFEIEDNGCGIPKEQMKNIFIPSFTLKGDKDGTGSYKTGIKGTGYGLSNVKKYIEQNNGNISMKSVFGTGTKFTISLPVKELTEEEK